jgi:thiol-disulfide isomerase/thioredoxin
MLIALLGAALVLGAAPGREPSERPDPVRRTQPHDYVLLAPDARDGAELIGRRAPAWSFERWIRSPALTPQDLRGKVVLLRWWTDGCSYCTATLPGLEALRKRYADDGLLVIGVYHPKPPRAVPDRDIVAMANRLGFKGPIAVDQRWTTLERYWLAGHEREFTSVSFLIDRDGLIRWVQRGGEYHPSADPRHARCDLEYRGLEKALADLLGRS